MEQAMLIYSHLRKAFQKQTKTIEEEGGKNVITNQNKWSAALINKEVGHKQNCKEIFEELVKERLDEIKEWINYLN